MFYSNVFELNSSLKNKKAANIKVWAFDWKDFGIKKHRALGICHAYGKIKMTMRGFVLFFNN